MNGQVGSLGTNLLTEQTNKENTSQKSRASVLRLTPAAAANTARAQNTAPAHQLLGEQVPNRRATGTSSNPSSDASKAWVYACRRRSYRYE